MEVGVLGVLLRSYSLNSLGVESSHCSKLVEQRLASLGILHSGILIDSVEISAGGDVADSSHNLQLGSTLVDRCDACVAIDALASVVFHEARTTVYLHRVVGILVTEFTAHTLSERSECIGKTRVILHLGTLFGLKLAVAGNVLVGLVHIDEASGFVEKRTRSVELSFHNGKHFGNSGELDDSLAKLAALLCVGISLAVGSLADTNRLSGNAKTCTVHKSHNILDKTKFARAAKFGFGILEYKFASRRSLDTHLVFDAAYGYATIVAVVDKHGKTATVVAAFLRACEHESDVTVAIGDETLHTIETPSAISLIESSL